MIILVYVSEKSKTLKDNHELHICKYLYIKTHNSNIFILIFFRLFFFITLVGTFT